MSEMMSREFKRVIGVLLLFFITFPVFAQEKQKIYNFSQENDYIIGGISISGIRYLDINALIGISGLKKGEAITIPGDALSGAAQRLWQQGLFSDVRISIDTIKADTAFLDIYLQERPRLSSIKFTGIRAGEKEDIVKKISLPAGSQVTSYIIDNTRKIIRDHFVEKGFRNTTVDFIQKDDPDQPNNVLLTINVDKKSKVKIGDIIFAGNEFFKDNRLRKQLKGTKIRNWNIFHASKLIDDKYSEDKDKLITFYNDNGFKDFTIISDSVYNINDKRVGLKIKVSEGNQYFLRKVDWVGNSVYTKEDLNKVFNVKTGTVYNQSLIGDRLEGKAGSEDAVSSLYLNNGYLFSNLKPIESKVEGDSVDLEIRIYEGDQAYINDVLITGNTRTNEHVARRELFTNPGDLFSKENIMRSIRQLGVLGHWDPEKINPTPLSDPTNGTVDLLYKLEEKANDQFEISGGWGAGMLVGTVGVRFNNFAMKNFFKPSEWRPYPSGDGQSLSIRAQSNGKIYQSYNLSFEEPWLGGKKSNNFTISVYRSIMTNGKSKGEDGRQSMLIDGVSVGLGKRLQWPDDLFSIYEEFSYQKYDLNNYTYMRFLFDNGQSNLLSFTTRLTRFSTGPNLIYPRSGSTVTLSLQLTPPYSFLSGKDMTSVTDEVKYKWIEFHKWLFKADYYFPLTKDDKMVLRARFDFGYLGYYNKKIGPSPFESFYLGGSGMTGYTLYGHDIIAMRGYTDGSLTPVDSKTSAPAGNVYSKMTFELRYPISLNQQATIYALTFMEAGRSWNTLREYNPFKLCRSAGVGLRANLPMFGLLGVDWGYGFDAVPTGDTSANKSQFSFVIGQEF
jgi:outer membrane protein insertion porin family